MSCGSLGLLADKCWFKEVKGLEVLVVGSGELSNSSKVIYLSGLYLYYGVGGTPHPVFDP